MKLMIRLLTVFGAAYVAFVSGCEYRTEQELTVGPSTNMQYVSGEVFIVRNGVILRMKANSQLLAGDVLYTSAGSSAEFSVGDAVLVRLGEAGLMKIANLNKADIDNAVAFHARLLTGYVSFNVDSLGEDDSVSLETGENGEIKYSVRGTIFVVEYKREQSRLVVGQGSVAVSRGTEMKLVEEGEQFVPNVIFAMSETQDADEEALDFLEESSPLAPQVQSDDVDTVNIDIRVYPTSSDIYIDGRRIGKGHFNGLLPYGKAIDVRVRNRGYGDETLRILAEKNESIVIELKPEKKSQDKNETQVPDSSQNSGSEISRRLKNYEKRINELKEKLNNALDILASSRKERLNERSRLRNEMNAQVEIERARAAVFETELNESRALIEKLQNELELR